MEHEGQCPCCGSLLEPEGIRESPALHDHDQLWRLWMVPANFVYVAIIVASWYYGWEGDPLRGGVGLWLIDVAFCTLFGIDYAIRMIKCTPADRWRYAFQLDNLLDVIVIVSPIAALVGVASLGVVRVIRVLKSTVSLSAYLRPTLGNDVREVFTRQRIRFAINLTIAAAVVAFAVVYTTETAGGGGSSGTAAAPPASADTHPLESPLDAAWWLTETITGVGYGDTRIETTSGRVSAMVLMGLGILVVGLGTAWVSSILVGKDDDREHGEIMRNIDEVKALIGGQAAIAAQTVAAGQPGAGGQPLSRGQPGDDTVGQDAP